MLHWALIFFVIAIVAAVLGARGVAGLSAEIGYFLVVIALVFLIIAFFTGGATPAMQPASTTGISPPGAPAEVGSAVHPVR
jgi:uncharacterized membrane protein YtjA (UPF0391 family)